VDGIFACEATAKIVTARGRDGIQAKSVAYDHPERRLIQAWSSGRPRLSPQATASLSQFPKDNITANFMLQTTIFSVNLCSEIADIKVCKE
jgi:hypothetical protein